MNAVDNDLPLFPVSMVGSWPRRPELLREITTLSKHPENQGKVDQLTRQQEKDLVVAEEKIGLDVISDGELNRDNYSSYVAQRFGGIELMDMLKFSDVLGPNCDFVSEIINRAGIKLSAINNAVCTGKLQYNNGLTIEDMNWLKAHTNKPIKAEIPGPYLLARSIWVPNVTYDFYHSQEDLASDIVNLLVAEVHHLQKLGVDIIQFDEPVLTEIVLNKDTGAERSFMCSALSKKREKSEELAFAVSLIKKVFDNIDRSKSIASLHTCRGNWGTNESALLSGSYEPLVNAFNTINPDMLCLEFSVRRAGPIAALYDNGLNKKYLLGIGVANPRSQSIENPYDIVAQVEKAMKYIPKEKIWLNPDCGFGTFSNSIISNSRMAEQKLLSIVRAAKLLRRKYSD